ncbi:MAG: tRNA pseudouridine(38-40) synthase TruA [Proteobacteria bacterium]|nr:tRNA pseudouridine(38-40) synthase TruA [Pseudomonadota bacterium]MBU1743083.1 tRNA pseudouridine(38-40) synthase TruA [Pseudomonadota bacterium]
MATANPLAPLSDTRGKGIPWQSEPTGRLALILAYQGTAYAGWQRQPNGLTVQQVVEESLSRICPKKVMVHAAGRTDAGVHARGQVAHAEAQTRLTPDELRRALNALLPEDVLVRAAGWVDPEFHAQYSARRKTYGYLIQTGRHRPLFDRDLIWHHPSPLDQAAMNAAARELLGQRDFSTFAGAGSEVKSHVREIYAARWESPEPGRLWFTVTADGFLRTMVRSMVGTLVQVGEGRFTPRSLSDIVASRDRSRAGPTAPARGLWLMNVDYRGEEPS